MKKILLLSSMAVLMLSSTIVLDSCKKGANDPGISLRSRKARLTGDWTISKASMISSSTSGGATTSSTTTIDGTTETQTNGGTSSTGTISYKISFKSDGTYTTTTTETFTGYSQSSTSTGNWNFVSGGNDLKNKEAIIMTELSNTSTTTVGGSSSTSATTNNPNTTATIWKITRLANKELVVAMDNKSTSGSSSSSDSGTMTFVQ